MYSPTEEVFSLGILVSTITELCKERGLTFKALEKELGFGNGTIRRWGTSKPAISAVVKVASYFNVSVDYLLGLSSYRQHDNQNITVSKLGLSERATTALVKLSLSDNAFDSKKVAVINLLLADDVKEEWGSQLLRHMADYLFAQPIPKQLLQFTPQGIKVLDSEPDFSDPVQTTSDIEYAAILHDKVLIDRVTNATEAMRFQIRNPQTVDKVLDSKTGERNKSKEDE